MAQEVVATFSGPLDSLVGPPPVNGSELTVHNATSHCVARFGISGRTAKFPIRWDEFPKPSGGPVGNVTIVGKNTEVVMVSFQHFNPNETVKFEHPVTNVEIDADLHGDRASLVRVLDLTGARAAVIFDDGTTAFGEFEPTVNGTLRAVLTK